MPSKWAGNARPSHIIPTPMIVGGSRTFTDYKRLCKVLDKKAFWLDDVILYCGACKEGADKLAIQWAEFHWYDRKLYHADWKRKGKSAGMIRNRRMVKEAAEASPFTIAVFFWDGKSPGTENCIENARKYLSPGSVKVVRF